MAQSNPIPPDRLICDNKKILCKEVTPPCYCNPCKASRRITRLENMLRGGITIAMVINQEIPTTIPVPTLVDTWLNYLRSDLTIAETACQLRPDFKLIPDMASPAPTTPSEAHS